MGSGGVAHGGSGGGGGGAGGGGAGSGGGGGAGGTDVGGATQPPLTDCAVVQQILLGSTLLQSTQIGIARAGDGFALTSMATIQSGLSASFAYAPDAGTIGPVTTGQSSWGRAATLGLAGRAQPADQLLLFTLSGGAFPMMQLSTAVLDAGATTFGAAQPLFSTAFIDQNGMLATRVAFDGLHSLIAAGSPVVGQPVAGLVGADGRLIGQAQTIATTASEFLWSGLQAIPTTHGGAVSLMDQLDGEPRWRLVELDGSGAVALDATMPLADGLGTGAVPRVLAPSPRGFAAVFQDPNGGVRKLVELDRTGAGSGPAITRAITLPSDGYVMALGTVGTSFLLAFNPPDMATLALGRVQADGTVHNVNVVLQDVQSPPGWIAAEGDGLTFSYRTSGGLAIVRVGCPP